jgi:hypothetical protein
MPRAYRALPPADLLRQLFRYDADTGELFRVAYHDKYRNLHALEAPRPITHINRCGYLCCTILGVANYQVQRVVWKIATGEDPGQLQVDHIDHNRLNNALSNLRLATPSQNKGYSSKPAKGYWRTRGGRYLAMIIVQNEVHYLGCHDTEQEANRAYVQGCRLLRGEFSNV